MSAIASLEDLKSAQKEGLSIYPMCYLSSVVPQGGTSEDALCSAFTRRSLGAGGRYLEATMPAIASLEDLKSAQKDLLEAKDLNELKAVFKKWRRIGWKNICKLWLEERTPEQLKGESE